MSDELTKKAWFVVQLFRECDAIQLPHKPTEEVLTGMIDRIELLQARSKEAVETLRVGFKSCDPTKTAAAIILAIAQLEGHGEDS